MKAKQIRVCHYFSTIRGLTEQQTGEPIVHYGKVYKIPKEDFAQEKQFAYEVDPATLLRDFGDEEAVPDGILERYEIRDIETGDVWVMYRVPYWEKPAIGGPQ